MPFSFVFDPAVLWQGSAAQIALGAGAMLASTALWAIAFAGWCGRPLGRATRLAIGAAALVAVIAPAGSLPWALGFGAGWALAVMVFVTARRAGTRRSLAA